MIAHTKQALRTKFLDLLRQQSSEDRLKKSRLIAKKLFAMREFKVAKTILFYASFDGEVDTFEMMTQAQKLGKKILLPTIIKDQKRIVPAVVDCLEENLHSGPYGIKQPKILDGTVSPEEMDFILVPGVAFDRNNFRLGRGHGYYDRFLGGLPKTAVTCGLAFDFQIVENLPSQAHDIKVSRILCN